MSARNKSDVFALGICMLSLAWAKAEPTLSSDRPMELAFPALQVSDVLNFSLYRSSR